MIRVVESNSPRSQWLKVGIAKLQKFGEKVDVDLDIEQFSHQQLRSQILQKPKNPTQGRRVLSKARLITSKDIARLKEEKEAKEREKLDRVKKRKRGNKKTASSMKLSNSEPEELENEWETSGSEMSDLESSESDSTLDVIVLRESK
jgi:hypothetical protein